jgi:hypothetical protein
MKSPRTCAALAFVYVGLGLGCTGELVGERGSGNSGPGDHEPGSSGGSRSGAHGGNGGGSVPGVETPAVCATASLAHARVWRLSHTQYRNTLADVFGYHGTATADLPADSRLDGFSTRADRLGFSPLLMEHYFRVSDDVAADVGRRSGEFLGCAVAALGQGPCLADFLRGTGRRAWRRALTDDEIASLTSLYATAAAADGPDTGFKSVVSALMLSPNFFFRSELGAGGEPGSLTQLTDYEVASALSYALWDAPPDAQLLDLAGRGTLHDPAVLAAQVERLFADQRAPEVLNAFLRQWLKIDDLGGQDKSPMLFPGYSRAVGAELMQETRLLLDGIVFDSGGDRSVRSLFTASYGYVNARTAKLVYGLDSTATALTKVELDHARRRGILTSGAFLAAHADSDATKVVDRGSFFREQILCADVPPPPQDFKFEDPNITEDMTAREKLLAHAKNPACKTCHELFDGIGFALENYDPVGAFRTMDRTKVIDPSGTTPLELSGDVSFANFVELVDKVAKLPEPYACFSQQYLSYSTGLGASQLDSCQRDGLAASFAASGYRVDALVRAVLTSSAFTTRQN